MMSCGSDCAIKSSVLLALLHAKIGRHCTGIPAGRRQQLAAACSAQVQLLPAYANNNSKDTLLQVQPQPAAPSNITDKAD